MVENPNLNPNFGVPVKRKEGGGKRKLEKKDSTGFCREKRVFLSLFALFPFFLSP